jgi:ATP/maltotriose-dependent transcriptional regulator MalT
MTDSLLATKFFFPGTRPEIVSRDRLIMQLNESLYHKATLISAPAGFGKTTLVSEWARGLQVESTENTVSWLSLDANDNNLLRFLTYFITALRKGQGAEAAIGEGALDMLQLPQIPSFEDILTSLINEIVGIRKKIIFVLDDYHLIDDQDIHESLSFLIEFLPQQMHLVIVTRHDPSLPLGRLRARGQLTELRASDLRFTPSEAAEFLNQVMGLNLLAEDISALEKRTEGWIAGLQLAAISMRGHKDATSFIKSFTGSHRLVLDYLIEEVLSQQPESIQSFLLKTSVLERLNGSLCNALTGQENAQKILERIDHNNLFIIPLDSERRWYRYHHLFMDLLRQRLEQSQKELIPVLHRRASKWYEQNKLDDEALDHAFAAGDFERAADLCELMWPSWSENERSLIWFRWVKKLPEELIRLRPVLSVAFAQALLNAGELEAADARLTDVERCLESASDMNTQPETQTLNMIVVDEKQYLLLPAWLATTRAYHAQATGDVRGTVEYCERALELFPEEEVYNRAAVTGLIGLAYWANGDLEAAHATFSDGLFQNVHDRIKGTFVLANMKMALGQLREAERACERGLRLAKDYIPAMPLGTEDIYSGVSEIHREQGKLEIAAQDLQMSKKLGEKVDMPDWQYRWCVAQSRLDVSMGKLDAAIAMLDKASRVYVRTPVPNTSPVIAMKARVWVKQNRIEEAQTWVRERELSFTDDLSYMREFEHITLVRIFIAQYKNGGERESIRKALGLLDRLIAAAEEKGRRGCIIEMLVLEAMAFEAQDQIPSAVKSLERALQMAQQEGYQRIFVDEGAPIETLLGNIHAEDDKMKKYIKELLAAFEVKEAHSVSSSGQPLIEPLSERELEVLQLLAEGLTNPAIAARLYVSHNTIKVHTRNIYGKLGINNRTQAAAKARELGILSSSNLL